MDADEPEECRKELNDDQSGIGLGGGEERREQLDQNFGEGYAGEGTDGGVDDGTGDDGAGEGDDVAEVLGDGAGDLLGQLDGEVATDAKLVHADGDERRDEGRVQTAGAHARAVERIDLGSVEHSRELRNGEQQHRALSRNHGRSVVEHLTVRHLAVHRGRKVLCGGSGAHYAHDAHGEVVELAAPIE